MGSQTILISFNNLNCESIIVGMRSIQFIFLHISLVSYLVKYSFLYTPK